MQLTKTKKFTIASLLAAGGILLLEEAFSIAASWLLANYTNLPWFKISGIFLIVLSFVIIFLPSRSVDRPSSEDVRNQKLLELFECGKLIAVKIGKSRNLAYYHKIEYSHLENWGIELVSITLSIEKLSFPVVAWQKDWTVEQYLYVQAAYFDRLYPLIRDRHLDEAMNMSEKGGSELMKLADPAINPRWRYDS